MATRSYICKKIGKDKFLTIYCHWDGSPSFNGRILFQNDNNEMMVDKLLDLGDLSSLGEYLEPNPNKEHTFEHPQNNVCVAYGRDRGEKGVEAKEMKLINLTEAWVDYVYIYKDDEWYIYNGKYITLEKVLKEEGVI